MLVDFLWKGHIALIASGLMGHSPKRKMNTSMQHLDVFLLNVNLLCDPEGMQKWNMISEMRGPSAIYPSLFVAVVTVIKGSIIHFIPHLKKTLIALSFFHLPPQKSSNWFEN